MCFLAFAPGGVKSVAVRTQNDKDMVLVKPSHDFWPLSRYRARFGSPSRPANKKLGHKKCMLSGHPGVIVPGDDGEGPWKVEDRSGFRLEQDREEDLGSSGGEEELAAERFSTLRSQQDEAFREMAVGAMADILASYELDDAGKKNEELRRSKRAAMRKKRKDKRPKHTHLAAAFCCELESSGDEEEDAPPNARHRRRAAGAASSAAGSSQALSAAGAQAAPAAGSSGGAGGAGGEKKEKKSAPKKDVFAMEQQMWAEFKNAGTTSQFFSSTSHITLRLLVRWSNVARTKLAAGGNLENRAQMEVCQKRFQIMESCIKIHRSWTSRGTDVARAYQEFDRAWAVLESFANAAPEVRIESAFMMRLRFELLAIAN